ncbi:MAG: MgtC/SapB family protein, partial [Clostridia bacterium]|nr:MgtC/SapB family protein [Clostridia bacterium]
MCGGLIGIEREHKRRPAGFRTHILICLGASMTTLTSQYLFYNLNLYTDIGRLGAQVVAGIGFIGAGAIIVTKRRQVKGLTTAAGLWTCAIIGLAIGAGYYEAALISTFVILIAEVFFVKFEYWVLVNSRNLNIYVEYDDNEHLDNIIRLVKGYRIVIIDLEITKSGNNSCAIFQLQLP